MPIPELPPPEGNHTHRSARKSPWAKGDRVLAPWEPTYLYAGTIDNVADGRALIQFDDGDSGLVDLEYVQPLALERGRRVMSRRRMGHSFFPGEIEEVDGENVHVEFDDGKEEWTTVASLRIPCSPMGNGAKGVQAKSHMAFLDHLEEGSRVWALWNNAALFPGTVSERSDDEAHIEFDDGDDAWVRLEHLLPLDLIVGMRVMSRRRMGPHFSPAVISDTEGDRVQVRFDDGNEEWTKASALALPLPAPQPPADATANPEPQQGALERVKVGWNPRTVILIGSVVVAAAAALFFWLGRR